MHKCKQTLSLILAALTFLTCDLIEPEQPKGSIAIVFTKEDTQPALKKETTSIYKVHVVLKKGGNDVYNEMLTKSGGRFDCEIKDLDAGSDYSLKIYGKNSSSAIIAEASKSNIRVSDGKQSSVSMTWVSKLALSVNETKLTVNAAANSSSTFKITSNTSWSITDDVSWLTVSPSSGSNDGTITVTATEANSTASSRSATVTVSGTGVASKTIPVTQNGYVYQTVRIGNQVWMAENLKVTNYRNGDPIPKVTSDSEWIGLLTGAYCAYNNDENNAETYGYLYNWYVVKDNRNIAPTGWHVPTDEEWQTLFDYLGGLSVAGGKMKESGTTHWLSPNTSATNESGFTALPAGYRFNDDGFFDNLGDDAIFWSSTESNSTFAWYLRLTYDSTEAYRYNYNKQGGLSIRLVKD